VEDSIGGVRTTSGVQPTSCGGGLDRGRPNDLGGPADLLGDLPERRAAATDHHAGLLGLDDDLAGVLVEVEVGHAGLLRDHRPDLLLGARRG